MTMFIKYFFVVSARVLYLNVWEKEVWDGCSIPCRYHIDFTKLQTENTAFASDITWPIKRGHLCRRWDIGRNIKSNVNMKKMLSQIIKDLLSLGCGEHFPVCWNDVTNFSQSFHRNRQIIDCVVSNDCDIII